MYSSSYIKKGNEEATYSVWSNKCYINIFFEYNLTYMSNLVLSLLWKEKTSMNKHYEQKRKTIPAVFLLLWL